MTRPALSTAQAVAEAREHSHIHLSYRRDIDGLRAIAVLAVVAFHAFPRALPGGFVGVDVFFVISGFLITKVILVNLGCGTFSVTDFYSRRVRRIFPALIVVLAACLAFGWKSLLAEDLAQLAKHIFGGATFASNLVLWREASYFDKVSEAKPLLHLWSLGIEEQFYVAWPLLLWWSSRRGITLARVIAVTALLSFCINVAGVASHPTSTFYSPLSRAWELLLGASLATPWLAKLARRTPLWQLTTASAAGLILIVVATLWLKSDHQFPGWWALLPTLGACLIIAAGPTGWVNRSILARSPMVAIGLISFPLYLWHWPLLALGRAALPDGHASRVAAALLVLSALLAWATYQLVEKPLRFGGNSRQKRNALVAAMIVIATLAGVTLRGAGFPSRYPEIIQKATQYDLDGFRAGIRNRACFMDLDQDASQYSPECVDRGSKPLWLLWGDSGAASLYPGLRALSVQSGTFRLAQATSSLCPPLIGYASKSNSACGGNNDAVLEMAKRNAVDVVVLAAIWFNYDNSGLEQTIVKIREAGIKRVIVLGPAPAWRDPPSKLVFRLWKDDPLHRTPPARLDYRRYGLPESNSVDLSGKPAAALEESLRDMALRSGAGYVSLLAGMCDVEGCLMRASSQSGDSFYLDNVHLNRRGSEFAIEAAKVQLNAAASGKNPD
jgi:peptidoglycan/LPS O-acetylase OafA/YrhL